MESNKILIGVQFTYEDATPVKHEKQPRKSFHLELYVLRDITLNQLLEGIFYGLDRVSKEDPKNVEIYEKCKTVYNNCYLKTKEDKGRVYYTHIKLTSYNANVLNDSNRDVVFYIEDGDKPICDLGFIDSTRLIFDETGELDPRGQYNTAHVIDAFSTSEKIAYPEYNISTRQLYKFDDTPINIIPPSDPPKKSENSLISLLLPTLISVGVMLGLSAAFMTGGYALIAIIPTIITTIINWKKQKDNYKKGLAEWKSHYQNYIDKLIQTIKDRQKSDVEKLDELYPDILTLINDDDKGIYTLNDRLYSRSQNDDDFLTFRIGVSDNVPSLFEISGEKKDVVFSEASYVFENECLQLFSRDELDDSKAYENLCDLPLNISKAYKCLKDAPLLYSLKNKGALGVVGRDVNKISSKANIFISRMIFELCYYHSPEKLQFVIFFDPKDKWSEIENTINRYKFMPHFRGLFENQSQFVFDEDCAHQVLSRLAEIMTSRANETGEKVPSHIPHIVFIIFDDHGLKEHTFAQFLPQPPEAGKEQEYNLSLSFVFATKFKEHLPAYCDDIVDFSDEHMVLIPRNNATAAKFFRVPDIAIDKYVRNVTRAFRFLSSVYFTKVAQNGNVPSSVTLFEVLNVKSNEDLKDTIKNNWGLGTQKSSLDITSSLKTAIGKTDSGFAYLDLHEKGDGPHMLVAGTTGSGKTETIITYLLGLCTQFRPDELNLLLVDMKGGGFTKRLGNLPHVVGAVTDVDGDENGAGAVYMLNRFLQSMQAEIKKRKILFNKLHVDSIDDYIKAWRDIDNHIVAKKIDKETAKDICENREKYNLTHLMLVIDEFTELKRFSSENSDIDFIKEITTIARIGRSLGFHIILISQNIEGAITEDIRVNSKSRLCLRVATKQASKEMLGNELAAHPSMPGRGRAYLMVGTGSRLDYFQSGFASVEIGTDIPMEITYAKKRGQYSVFYKSDKDNKKLKEEKAKKIIKQTQLEAVVEAIQNVHEAEKLLVPTRIYKAPLPTNIALLKDKVVDVTTRKIWKEW